MFKRFKTTPFRKLNDPQNAQRFSPRLVSCTQKVNSHIKNFCHCENDFSKVLSKLRKIVICKICIMFVSID